MKKVVITLIVLLAVAVIWREVKPPFYTPGWGFEDFSRIPVLEGGRIQPIDSVARNALLASRKNTAVLNPDTGKKIPPGEWATIMFFNPELASRIKAFRIDFNEVQGSLRLPVGEEKFFSLQEIAPQISTLLTMTEDAEKVEAERRTPVQKSILQLQRALEFFLGLHHTVRDPRLPEISRLVDRFQQIREPALVELQKRDAGQPHNEETITEFFSLIAVMQRQSQSSLLRVIPPEDPKADPDGWKTLGEAVLEIPDRGAIDPVAQCWLDLSRYYEEGNGEGFAETVAILRKQIEPRLPMGAAGKVVTEVQFLNKFQPFIISASLYVLVFVVSLAAWVGWTRSLNRTAFWIAMVAFVLHTLALAARIYVSGRPPVTNLYSSAVFIGWGAIMFGLLIDALTKRGFGVLVGSVIGFLTLLVAHQLSLSGDTLAMLVAVLDDNFWLATHVVVISLGYVAVFLAGALGIFYIFYGLFTSKLDKGTGRTLANVTYGVVCFGLLFSFVGTILGGIWADQSWGRFWGWDPKENGALIIVVWTAIILHARWGGFIRERGLMVMAVFGNIVTAWSWFGTNFLGVGLHSYGFHESGFMWLKLFVVSQLAIMILGGLPLKVWRSRGGNPTPKAA